MQHYIAIYVVSKEKSTRCRKSKHSLKLYNPTPRTVKVLLLDTSVYHTHASPVPELEVWKLLQSSLGGGGVLPFPGGRENPTRSPNRTHTGSWFRVRNGIEDSNGGKKNIPPKTNGGELEKTQNWPTQKIILNVQMKKAILDFHLKRFEVSGIHLSSRPAPPPMWPKLK